MTDKARHDEHSDQRTPQSAARRPGQGDDTTQPREELGGSVKAAPQPSWDPFSHADVPKIADDKVEHDAARPVSRTAATMRSLRFPFEASPPDVTAQQLGGSIDDDSDR